MNGTGSASANALFTKAVFSHGRARDAEKYLSVEHTGLPTWYEVRISEKGHLGRREGVDLMISVNPQSMRKDYADVRKGGYFLYDSSKPLPPSYERNDITHIGIPLMNLCNAEFTDARQRQLFKNIVYIGALVSLFKIEVSVVEDLVGQQFKGKEKLIEPNIRALKMGEDWVLNNFDSEFDLRVERRDALGDKILFSGNSACARSDLRRCDRRRVVPDHAFDIGRRRLCKIRRKIPRRSGDRQEQLRHRPGRGRACRDRHGDGSFVERRASIHRNQRPGRQP